MYLTIYQLNLPVFNRNQYVYLYVTFYRMFISILLFIVCLSVCYLLSQVYLYVTFYRVFICMLMLPFTVCLSVCYLFIVCLPVCYVLSYVYLDGQQQDIHRQDNHQFHICIPENIYQDRRMQQSMSLVSVQLLRPWSNPRLQYIKIQTDQRIMVNFYNSIQTNDYNI